MTSYLEVFADRVGRISTGLVIVGAALVWMLLNVALGALGIEPIERFPFHWLQRVILLGNLVVLVIFNKVRRQRRARAIEQVAKMVAASTRRVSRPDRTLN